MLTLSDRDNTEIHKQDLMFDTLKQQIRCAVPGIIQSFDNVKCTAEVQPAITEIFYNYNGEKKNIKLPLLQDVPVLFPASGSAMLSFPVNKGDECLLIFADMCIDGWWQNGDIQNQAEQRRHDLSDAFAILSPFSQPKAGNITNGINTTQTELRNMSNTQKVVLTDQKLDLIGNVFVNGAPIGSGGATTVTIAVGETTTGEPGTDAQVVNTGTDVNAVFNFTIPRGEKGDQGNKGDTGKAATVAAGTTTTLPAGSSASVTNSGTANAAVFNFSIPQGAQGEQGIQGKQGEPGKDGAAATITAGTVTTLPAGSAATVTNSGTSSEAVFDFGIPKGEKGDTGSAASVSVGTTSTLSPGSNATVTNSGTSSDAVFNFGIPKGSQGDAATIQIGTVTTLPAGSNATVTNSGTSSAAVFDFGIPKGDTGTVSNVSYNDLLNKPSVNGHTLSGPMTDASLEVYGKNNAPPYPVTSVNGQTGDVSLNIPNIVTLTNVSASNWVSSQTYPDYPYQCSIANSAISASSFVDIVFDAASATSGDYAPLCSTESGAVVIFSKTDTAIIIPTILVVNP